MLSPKLKSDIRKLWDHFWSGGIANPLTAIEQITYLVFLKRLEDLDDERARAAQEARRFYNSIFSPPIARDADLDDLPTVREGEEYRKYPKPKLPGGPPSYQESHDPNFLRPPESQVDPNTFRWSYIKRLPSEERLKHMRGPVFEWLKTIEGNSERMRDAVFIIRTASLLQSAIEIIDGLFVQSRNQDTLGDIYEYLLSEIAEAGRNGQFRTPRHIIRAMCDLVDPQLGERICDPACGTAGFLVNAYQHILKSHTSRDILEFEAEGSAVNLVGDLLTADQHDALRRNHFYGFDFDRTMVRLGWMNMIQHGLENPQVNDENSLGSRFNKRLIVNGGDVGDFDVVLANPPFAGTIDKTDIGESLRPLGTNKTELLFLELILQLLRVGGRAAVIVPEGVLFGATRAHKELRRKLVRENQINAVVSLPGGVFQPYTGVKTSLLVFARGGETGDVWFYDVSQDGYSLNAKRAEQFDQNDLWDMTLKYRLHHAAAFRQPAPAFVDGDTWRMWGQMTKQARTAHYAKPVIMPEKREDNAGIVGATTGTEIIEVPMLKGVEAVNQAVAKDWQATEDELINNDLSLSAAHYKPPTVSETVHEPPAQIIRDLQGIEQRIQDGLGKLLAMVEGAE